jgi:thiol-disulfide isomerase/thioredoxin
MQLRYFILIYFLLGQFANGSSQAFEIHAKIPSFHNDTIILGHRFNASFIPKDTVILNAEGTGTFTGDESLPHGMYLVYLPDQSFFDLLISDDQFFSFENDTGDFIQNMVVTDSRENEAFYEYQRYIQKNRTLAEELQAKLTPSAADQDAASVKQELEALTNTVQNRIGQYISENQDNFFGVFLKGLQEIKVPDPPLDDQGKPIDPAFQYRYYKTHYFDNFDVSDIRLLRTPFYEQKLMTYIEKVVPQHPDSLIREVDMLIGKSRSDPQLFRYMLITLFNHFAQSQIMGMDAVYIHIADRYYIPEADWSDPEFISKLKERVEKSMPTLIGSKATDIQFVELDTDHFLQAAEDEELKKNPYVGRYRTLYDVDAKFTILYFWESDCSHCKVSTPALHNVYQRLKPKGVEVIAFNNLGGEEGKVKWINYINENGYYDWINCWNPYDFGYKTIYDILSTPQLYVLDEDKTIIAKRIGPEQAEKIIESILESNQ